jgi:hypothetical protein
MHRVIVAMLGLTLLSGACSKSSTPTSPSTSTTSTPVVTSYSGIVVFGTSGQTGELTLTTSVTTTASTVSGPAVLMAAPGIVLSGSKPNALPTATAGTGTVTGTLTLPTGTTAVTGTLSSAGALTLQGTGVSLTGTINSDGTLFASGTGPGGVTLGATAAATSATGQASTLWAGCYRSSHKSPNSGPNDAPEVQRNTLVLTIEGSPSATNVWPFNGAAQDSSNPGSAVALNFTGTVRTDVPNTSPADAIFRGSLSGRLVQQSISFSATINTTVSDGLHWEGTLSGTSPDGGPTTGTWNAYRNGAPNPSCPIPGP